MFEVSEVFEVSLSLSVYYGLKESPSPYPSPSLSLSLSISFSALYSVWSIKGPKEKASNIQCRLPTNYILTLRLRRILIPHNDADLHHMSGGRSGIQLSLSIYSLGCLKEFQ